MLPDLVCWCQPEPDPASQASGVMKGVYNCIYIYIHLYPSSPVTYILGSWVVNNTGIIQGTVTYYIGNWAVHIHTHTHMYVHIYIHIHKQINKYARIDMHMYIRIHTYMHACTYIHTYIHTYMYTLKHMCLYKCIYTCIVYFGKASAYSLTIIPIWTCLLRAQDVRCLARS